MAQLHLTMAEKLPSLAYQLSHLGHFVNLQDDSIQKLGDYPENSFYMDYSMVFVVCWHLIIRPVVLGWQD